MSEELNDKLDSLSDQIDNLGKKYELHAALEEFKTTQMQDALQKLEAGQKENKEYFIGAMNSFTDTFNGKLERCRLVMKDEIDHDYLKRGDVEVLIDSKNKKMVVWMSSIIAAVFVVLENISKWVK